MAISRLDPMNTGYMSPEVYSGGGLNVQGYRPAQNVCKSAPLQTSDETMVDKTKGKHALDKDAFEGSFNIADLELGLHFSEANISHKLATRHKSFSVTQQP